MSIPQQPPEGPWPDEPGIEIPPDQPTVPEEPPVEFPEIDEPGYEAPGVEEPGYDI